MPARFNDEVDDSFDPYWPGKKSQRHGMRRRNGKGDRKKGNGYKPPKVRYKPNHQNGNGQGQDFAPLPSTERFVGGRLIDGAGTSDFLSFVPPQKQ